MTRNFVLYFVTLALLGIPGNCKLVRHTFNIAYTSGSPDGVHTNHILAINDMFPGPVVEADVGDLLEITVINNIQDGQNVTIHWHGIHMRGTPFEDGPSQITQCPIKNGRHQVYRFQVPHAGTYWYHSHVNSQYTEGLWGVMIIRGAPEVWRHYYDEFTITLSDWYHASAHENEDFLLSLRSGGAPPFPHSALMNGIGRFPCQVATQVGRTCNQALQRRPVFHLQPGKTYRLRLINTSGYAAYNFTINGHELRTIEADGVDTRLSTPSQGIYIGAGQRYSFLLTTPRSGRIGSQFLIRASMRTEFIFRRPNNINRNPDALIREVTGLLVYSSDALHETTEQFDHSRSYITTQAEAWQNLRFLDERTLMPFDKVPAPTNYDLNVVLDITFHNDDTGIRRGSFNHRPVRLSSGMPQLAKMVHRQYMSDAQYPVYVKYGQVVQVVINNPERGPHPIHLHGHHFWVMAQGKADEGSYVEGVHQLNMEGVRRDTVLVKERSYTVLRFRADNVGVWTLHCHIDWHVQMGMSMTFIEAPERAHTIRVPEEAKRVCADHGVYI